MKPSNRRKKTSIIIAVSISAVFLLFLTARMTGMLNYYSIPTQSNRPAIDKGDIIFTSNLVKPAINDMICFRHTETMFEKKEVTYVFRMVATGGDKVEIRNGDLYLNGKRADEGLNLMHVYFVPTAMEDRIKTLAGIEDAYDPESYGEADFQVLGDSSRVFLTNAHIELLKKEKILFNKEILPVQDAGEIFDMYKKAWSPDNFGPYVVPKDHYFVLGDNRHGALDSRYIGPIPVSKYVATVINR